jgi:hypothetical protein
MSEKKEKTTAEQAEQAEQRVKEATRTMKDRVSSFLAHPWTERVAVFSLGFASGAGVMALRSKFSVEVDAEVEAAEV